MEQFFLGQSEILRKIVSSPLVGRVDSLTLLLTAISDTCRGITILAKNGLLNECYMLACALLERTVNCFYLLVCDKIRSLNDMTCIQFKKVLKA